MLAMAGLNTRGGAEMAAWAANDSVKTATIAGRPAPQSVIDEVIWVVGDEPILKSEVEITRLQSEAEGIKWDGDPDCQIPEQIAVQKLFLHQAALDSIEVTESEINQAVDQQINYWLSLPTIDGSRERLEQYQRKTISQMRQDMHDDFRDRQLVQKEQQELVKDIEVSPAEVRAYFKDMPTDSLPEIPTTVEVQILTKNPIIEQEEINRVKNQLREFTERVTKKETSFATLARLYSEDKGTARQGGELGYTGRGLLDPAFANAAFNLTDPNKISKIVETEFGYHIIQLIDRRGDKVNVRHILLRPRVSEASLTAAEARLDSIADDLPLRRQGHKGQPWCDGQQQRVVAHLALPHAGLANRGGSCHRYDEGGPGVEGIQDDHRPRQGHDGHRPADGTHGRSQGQYPGGFPGHERHRDEPRATEENPRMGGEENQGHLRLDQSAVSWVQFPIRGLGQVR